MSVENWDYENREAGINRASGVIASIADSWSRCREFGLRAAGTPAEIVLAKINLRLSSSKTKVLDISSFLKWNFCITK